MVACQQLFLRWGAGIGTIAPFLVHPSRKTPAIVLASRLATRCCVYRGGAGNSSKLTVLSSKAMQPCKTLGLHQLCETFVSFVVKFQSCCNRKKQRDPTLPSLPPCVSRFMR